jgi:SsrA-binding protein
MVGLVTPKRRGPQERSGDIATNRRARFRYELLETWEVGIALAGSEVKSVRDGKVALKDSYALVREGEVWLHNMHIAPYAPAAREGHDPERPRKLLMHKREIERLIGKTQEKGLTLVPTRMYFSGPRVKLELALARGKEHRDKRDTIRERDQRRDMERELKQRR